jgi:hypothetical protein
MKCEQTYKHYGYFDMENKLSVKCLSVNSGSNKLFSPIKTIMNKEEESNGLLSL